jgi:hypothetical protein
VNAERLDRLARARVAAAIKRKQQSAIAEKIEQGIPITQEEREALGRRSKYNKVETRIDNLASKLEIKPQNANQLRLLIERTAARYHYNPIANLIIASTNPETELKDQIAIHKALLPYMAPQLSPVKQAIEQDDMDSDKGKVSVKVVQFVFERKADARPIHEQQAQALQQRLNNETTQRDNPPGQ